MKIIASLNFNNQLSIQIFVLKLQEEKKLKVSDLKGQLFGK